ncbi:MAG: phage major capsid protein [Candidatus Scalindua sp.]|nr:phage major capsid protein [Candidatus Scalindua sp.]
MAYDGIQFGARVDGTTERKLHAKVVDNVLNAPSYFSRLMGMGKPFIGKTYDVTVDITQDTQGEWFTGLETLNSAAANTTITLSYAHTAFSQPKVSIMLESFANTGSTGTIPLDAFKYEKAAAEALNAVGQTVYGTGAGDEPNGLGNIVLDSGTIGGQSRTTYTQLNATVTASGGTLTLAKMATLDDTISSASMSNEEPNMGLTTKTGFSLYEQLLSPSVRSEFRSVGYDAVPIRGDSIVKRVDLKGAAGFTALSYRGFPIMRDDYATSGVLFFLNERYYAWHGRSIVPDEYREMLSKVNLGTTKAYEGTGAEAMKAPSEYNGWFYQKPQMLPNQAGTIARFYVIGQICATGFRRLGKLTGITGV